MATFGASVSTQTFGKSRMHAYARIAPACIQNWSQYVGFWLFSLSLLLLARIHSNLCDRTGNHFSTAGLGARSSEMRLPQQIPHGPWHGAPHEPVLVHCMHSVSLISVRLKFVHSIPCTDRVCTQLRATVDGVSCESEISEQRLKMVPAVPSRTTLALLLQTFQVAIRSVLDTPAAARVSPTISARRFDFKHSNRQWRAARRLSLFTKVWGHRALTDIKTRLSAIVNHSKGFDELMSQEFHVHPRLLYSTAVHTFLQKGYSA